MANPNNAAAGRLGLYTRLYGADDPRTQAARTECRLLAVERAIREVVEFASSEQIDHLRQLLPTV